MATRSQIGFYEKEPKLQKEFVKPVIILYKHYDGYPDEMIPMIDEIVKQFINERKQYDIEYLSGYMLYKFKQNSLNILKNNSNINEVDLMIHAGVSTDIHKDIDYFYNIYPKRYSKDVKAVMVEALEVNHDSFELSTAIQSKLITNF